MTTLRIAVDTGGTFTDFVIAGGNNLSSFKLLSTPDDPSRAIIRGLKKIGAAGFDFVHGSTVATNAILEAKGARTALVTNDGFTDLLYLGRGNRPTLYDLSAAKATPLLQPEDCIAVRQRTGPAGEDLIPLADTGLTGALFSGFEAVAVSLLHSYRNPEAELKLIERIRKLAPGLFYTASSDLLREFREYERAATVFLNSYVGPKMQNYLSGLSDYFGHSRWFISGSGGGRLTYAEAKEFPVKTVLSGPAGGVAATLEIGRMLGTENLLSFDMGGTSTDVALVSDGEFTITKDSHIRDMPVAVPVIDIHTVGAGGGSIAGIDAGGALQVGPKSAGASPGPACYGQGGTEPTVSDANLVLGRLPADYRLADDLTPDHEAALTAFAKTLSIQSGSLTPGDINEIEKLALGTVTLANTHMENALRKISLERGYDPRQFALVSFGGAGGLHSVELARALRIPKVIVPKLAATLSAYGMLCSDELHSSSRTVLLKDPAPVTVAESVARVAADYQKALREKGIEVHGEAEVTLDLRYEGQSYEITVAYDREDFGAGFHEAHNRMYGYQDLKRPLELVNININYRLPVTPPAMPGHRSLFKKHPRSRRVILADGTGADAGIYTAAGLNFSDTGLDEPDRTEETASVKGPALLLRTDTVVYIPEDAVAGADESGNTIIETGVSP